MVIPHNTLTGLRWHLLFALFALTPLLAADSGRQITAITLDPKAGSVLDHFGRVAAREIQRRYGVQIPVTHRGPAGGGLYLAVSPTLKGSAIEVSDRSVRALGGTPLAAVQALGMALRALEYDRGAILYRAGSRTLQPVVPLRGIYGPAHFSNTYEKMPLSEMAEIYDEWAMWGATTTWNWIDPERRVSPTSETSGAEESRQYVARVMDLLRAANQAGLETGVAAK